MSIIFNLGFKFHIIYEVIEMVSVFNNAQALENVGTWKQVLKNISTFFQDLYLVLILLGLSGIR